MSVSPTSLLPAISDFTSRQDKPAERLGSSFTSVASRPLLPRLHHLTTPAFLGVVTTRKHVKRARTNVTIACDGCKQARAKCDGKRPCQRCMRKSEGCKYDHGQDRRQHRGSQEAIQSLTARLVRYQRFVYYLRKSPRGDAHCSLQRLRSPSGEEVTEEDHKSPPVADVDSTAAVQDLVETEQDLLTAPDMQDPAALVAWIRHDLDLLALQASLPKEHSSGLDEREMPDPTIDPTIDPRIDRADFTVQRLLC
ncbi:uncharacterized protein Z520_10151 [Fonsecaea multimorphosa CBS 102226]|uniref:Zn(2)-C6 fungal-type domain-containing protein n=1 Tax=Fonsecaea multimorphosa CBS 102226 TaxID=1442371 RepID=A0A0D2GWZ3_9EURO|nr:uncharacterized protein Z520_10151 [Fonsecaea multimorphosa CBS 102226]KIX94125.1 hypothetical protein Z520_10151 [Fonsecaea multimorphosa CBS 102226]OAL19478.1 hypothetical protein AYO22_09640 [Fonsecaea multimorphosa]